jgi:hypothetical protein
MFEAALWYERERASLGAAFLAAVKCVFGRIEEGALQFPLSRTTIRRAILPRFPFGVFFTIEGDTATVLAVMHLHRNPSSWESRR